MFSVIGFYPGAGGNRYLRYINNLDYTKHNIAYDNLVPGQEYINRYLLNGVSLQKNIILTHCLNETHIKSLINDCNITLLKSDIKKSLHREWHLIGHTRYKFDHTDIKLRIEHYDAVKDSSWPCVTCESDFLSLPGHIKEEVDQMYVSLKPLVDPDGDYQRLLTAFSTISWHDEYYKKYPWQHTNSNIVDIDNSDSEFAQTMRTELNLDIDPMFDLAWDSYHKYGKDSELTQIYEQYKK